MALKTRVEMEFLTLPSTWNNCTIRTAVVRKEILKYQTGKENELKILNTNNQ